MIVLKRTLQSHPICVYIIEIFIFTKSLSAVFVIINKLTNAMPARIVHDRLFRALA